jgi:hypothetical protein
MISSNYPLKNSNEISGTDVLGMATKAIEDEATKSWQLTGQKMWITNGTLDGGKTTGDLFLVYGRTGPNRSDITSFLVEKDMPGFSVGQKINDKLGMRASVSASFLLIYFQTSLVCHNKRSIQPIIIDYFPFLFSNHSQPRNSCLTKFPSQQKT